MKILTAGIMRSAVHWDFHVNIYFRLLLVSSVVNIYTLKEQLLLTNKESAVISCHTISLFLHPSSLWFSDILRGYRKGPVA